MDEVTNICREYWYGVVKAAVLQHLRGIPPESINPRKVLARVPPISRSLGAASCFYFGASPSKALCVQASSTWAVTDDTDCGLAKKEKAIPSWVQIGTQAPIPCKFGGDSFCRWIGATNERRNQSNYLAVLTLGWSYILSARLVETQGNGSKMVYTNSVATSYYETGNRCAPTTSVDVSELDEDDAFRWWMAVLAPGQGWKAIVSHEEDGEYLAPWSVSLEDTHRITLKWQKGRPTEGNKSNSSPPSSKKAFQFLSRFSLQHNLHSQFLVALATAMLFPTHNYHGKIIQLPLPAEIAGLDDAPVRQILPEWNVVTEELPFYIALSCNPEVVISSLCGMFWEPNVPCNMVSPWLHPILYEVPEAREIAESPGFYHEILALICDFRTPEITPLWLGAVASGLTETVLTRVARGRPPLDANAFPWTGSPQSFMDIPGSGPYIYGDEKVRRRDAWRLLYLPPVVEDDLYYNSRPFSPWEPFGDTTAHNCVLRVRCHLHCTRHHLDYQYWNWELKDGSIVKEPGFMETKARVLPKVTNPNDELIPHIEFPQKTLIQEASEEASRDIFGWVTVNGEGVPPENVYNDPWLEDEDESGEELNIASDSDNDYASVGQGVSLGHTSPQRALSQDASETSRAIFQWMMVNGVSPEAGDNNLLEEVEDANDEGLDVANARSGCSIRNMGETSKTE